MIRGAIPIQRIAMAMAERQTGSWQRRSVVPASQAAPLEIGHASDDGGCATPAALRRYSAPQPLEQVALVPACDARGQKKDCYRWKCSHRVDLIYPVLQIDHFWIALIILRRRHHARLRPHVMINIAHTEMFF